MCSEGQMGSMIIDPFLVPQVSGFGDEILCMQTDTVQRKAPWWAWAFVVICGSIPVIALGGAIPGALGCGGAGFCYGIARNGKGSGQRRALLCSLVALGCWTLFGGLFLAVNGMAGADTAQAKTSADRTALINTPKEPRAVVEESPQVNLSRPAPTIPTASVAPPSSTPPALTSTSTSADQDNLTLDKRMEIYAKAARRRAMITSSQEALERRQQEGRTTEVHAKQLEHAKGMYESHLDFSCQFNKISRTELDAIIREGDSSGWPAG